MKDYYNFVHNCFVFESVRNYSTFEPTTFIVPYYAVKDIQENDIFVEVFLKEHLTSNDSFDKRIYKVNQQSSFTLRFHDEEEKQIFVKNIKEILKSVE